jgi:hypothetical protein
MREQLTCWVIGVVWGATTAGGVMFIYLNRRIKNIIDTNFDKDMAPLLTEAYRKGYVAGLRAKKENTDGRTTHTRGDSGEP